MRQEYVSLLRAVPALALGLSGEQLTEARRLAIAPVVTLPAGHWDDRKLLDTLGDAEMYGGVVVSGLVAHDLALDGREATHLLGPGDLVAPGVWPCRQLPAVRLYTAADRTRLALLDQTFGAIAQRWPTIAGALLVQAERQAERVALQNVIGHLPRAEERIVGLLWHLADRWGKEHEGGMIVPLTLSHEAIGHLTGGRRSTISVALAGLAERELVVRLANGVWWIAADSLALLSPSPRATPTRGIHLLGHGRALRKSTATV